MPYSVYLASLLKDSRGLEGTTRAQSTPTSLMVLAQVLLSAFTEFTSKFPGGAPFNVFPDPPSITSQHHGDRVIKSVFREYSILRSPYRPKKEAMTSGCKTLSSRSSTATHNSKPFITVSTGYTQLFPFLHFLRVWLCLLLPQSPQDCFVFPAFQQE